MASSMQDSINSIILSFINKANDEGQEGNSDNQQATNSADFQQPEQGSGQSSPKNSSTPNNGLNLLTQAATHVNNSDNYADQNSPNNANSPGDSHQQAPISGISLLKGFGSTPSTITKRTTEQISLPIHLQDIPTNPINMDDQERKKQERKRERNRIAAAKCRERKMTKINTLENEVKTLQLQSQNLALERDYYRKRCTKIVELVNQYIRNGAQEVPVSKIHQIIETITEEEKERSERLTENPPPSDYEPQAKHFKHDN